MSPFLVVKCQGRCFLSISIREETGLPERGSLTVWGAQDTSIVARVLSCLGVSLALYWELGKCNRLYLILPYIVYPLMERLASLCEGRAGATYSTRMQNVDREVLPVRGHHLARPLLSTG